MDYMLNWIYNCSSNTIIINNVGLLHKVIPMTAADKLEQDKVGVNLRSFRSPPVTRV